MRVLQFGRFWNDQHGGVERQAHLLSRGLAELGVEVVNLVASSNLSAHDDHVEGFRLVQAPSFGMVFRTAMSPALLQNAVRLHRDRPFDIFHLHLQDPLSHLASRLLPRNVKRVVTWHHGIVKQKLLMRPYLPLLQRELRRADAIVAATPAHFNSSSQIPNDIPVERRHVIPYGLDFAPLALTPRTVALRDALRQQAYGRPIVFALGRHVSYKGFNVLIDALLHTDALLILGGNGPLTPALKQQADALGLRERVLFSGRIAEDDLAAYFHACDVFCLPSVSQMEAFGLVQVEAFACGKPVVCTQLGNGVNTVNVDGETGLAVPVADPVRLSQALNQLFKDSALRSTLGSAGMRKALHVYSLRAMAEAHLKLYRSLLG